jgi:hypothetical protein
MSFCSTLSFSAISLAYACEQPCHGSPGWHQLSRTAAVAGPRTRLCHIGSLHYSTPACRAAPPPPAITKTCFNGSLSTAPGGRTSLLSPSRALRLMLYNQGTVEVVETATGKLVSRIAGPFNQCKPPMR